MLSNLPFQQHQWLAKIEFYNRFVSGIVMGSGEVNYDIDHFDGQSERWQKQLTWIDVAQNLLLSQLGNPHVKEQPYLKSEEDFLTETQILKLVLWRYEFEWGTVGLSYDTMSLGSALYIKYEHFKQITTWDELYAECEHQIQIAEAQDSSGTEVLSATLGIITLISPHFEFNRVHPRIHIQGIGLMNGPVVDVKVIVDREEIYYSVSVANRLGQSKANTDTLVNILREYIESY